MSDGLMSLWLSRIARHAGQVGAIDALDLGCGTGRFALPMAARLGLRVTGADASEGMLAKARAKDADGLVEWDVQDACALGYPPGRFGLVLLSHILHHLDSPPSALREVARVLRPGGVALVRYGGREQIRDDVVHRFFPEARELDERRTPTVGQTEEWLHGCGFRDVQTEEIAQRTCESVAERVRLVRARSTSVLTMIPEQAFEHGLRALQAYAEEHPSDEWLLCDRLSLTSGRKPGG